jgi:DNA-binding transcriptional LysR family regulator
VIDLRLLRYFVAVAEVEHVGRAAAALHISQSPLSLQLRQLEDSLGLRLFDRERQRLHLTSAGRWLLGESRILLERAEQLERDAARVARGDSGSVRIGFVKSAVWSGVLPAALRTFRSKRPGVSVGLRSASSATQVAAVLRGDLDVGLVHDVPPHEDLVHVELRSEPLLLALSSEHALARRASLAPKDLDGADWIVLAPEPGKHERLLAACGRAGFVPTVRFEASDQATVLGLVDAGMGLALLPKSAERVAPGGVVLRRLPWLRLSRSLHAIRRRAAASPFATEIHASLVEACATESDGRPSRKTRTTGGGTRPRKKP